MTGKGSYLRFSILQRVQHWVMVLSFVTLAATGLPQRYSLSPWAEAVIAGLGGIEAVRIVHRTAAVLFIGVTLFHFFDLIYRMFVLRVRFTMLPGIKDLTDLLDTVRYNLGMAVQHPKLPRYSYAEKMEYWSLVWGSLLMIATGFMLWNPIAVSQLLPGQFIPAAKMAHSAEALLAVLAVLIWHVYSVHLRTFNRSIFNGRLTRHQMEDEHAAELEEIESGVIRLPPSREIKRRRERVFLPVSLFGGIAVVAGLYGFLSMEQTAITTVPPAETEVAFLPATPTPTKTPTQTPIPTATAIPSVTPMPTPAPMSTPPGTSPVAQTAPVAIEASTLFNLMVIPHPLEGREDCLMCHAEGKPLPFPADHVGRPSSACLVCHATTQAGMHLPPGVKHDITGRNDCLGCHAVDVLPASHKTAGFSNKDCLLCHVQPANTAASAAAPAGSEVQRPAAGQVSFGRDILPLFQKNCLTCHADLAMGGLKLTDYQSFAKGGKDGPAFVAESPENSLIMARMKEQHAAVLSGADLQMLSDWIAAGGQDN
jgi:cytochrome b subunit of formate dehydrogenase